MSSLNFSHPKSHIFVTLSKTQEEYVKKKETKLCVEGISHNWVPSEESVLALHMPEWRIEWV